MFAGAQARTLDARRTAFRFECGPPFNETACAGEFVGHLDGPRRLAGKPVVIPLLPACLVVTNDH